ncbi:MAG: hypothetical protein IPG43_22145 [Proteobacteria bacterium]|nr:hypothetical protein [Pseudomonadota bacterium]
MSRILYYKKQHRGPRLAGGRDLESPATLGIRVEVAVKEMRLFYMPVWQTNVAEDQADRSTLRAAMRSLRPGAGERGQGVQRANFGGLAER